MSIREGRVWYMPFERFRKMLGRERILSWNHDANPGIVWRFPNPNSQNEMEKDPNKIDAFQVKIGERAVALMNNQFYEDTPPGVYWLKSEHKKGLEIIYIDQGQIKQPWGIPGTVLTKDNQHIGGHGYYLLRISEPRSFVTSIVSAQRAYTSEQVNDFIRSYVADILRQYLSNYTVLDGQILRERDSFTLAMKAKCQEMFSRWGLELIDLQVEVHLPDEVAQIMKEKAQTEIQSSLIKEIEIRKPLEEKRLEMGKSLDLLKIEI